MEKNGFNFLKQKFQLQNTEDVKKVLDRKKKKDELSGEKIKQPQKPEEKIEVYLDRFKEIIERESEDEKERGIKAFKKILFNKNIISVEDIPNRVYELEQEIAFNQGHGNIEITDEYKELKNNEIISSQKDSLNSWIDYLSSEDASFYPDWAKYWVLNSVLKIGKYNKEKRSFDKRGKSSVAPFPSLNAMAVSKAISLIQDKIEKKDIENFSQEDDKEFEKILAKEDFGKYYALALESMLEFSEKGLENIKGEWVKYNQGDNAQKLFDSIQGYPLEWCTAGSIETAQSQLNGGDFYVYYSENTKGENKIPRLAIRMNGSDEIGEVRGIEKNQNIDNFITPVLEEKMKDFGSEGKKYEKKSQDMEKLTVIYDKVFPKNEINIEDLDVRLSNNELMFLYQINNRIEGFGYGDDPRIKTIIDERDIKKDLYELSNASDEKELIVFLIEYDLYKYFKSNSDERIVDCNLDVNELLYVKEMVTNKNYFEKINNQIVIEKIQKNKDLSEKEKEGVYKNNKNNLFFEDNEWQVGLEGIYGYQESQINFDRNTLFRYLDQDIFLCLKFLNKNSKSLKNTKDGIEIIKYIEDRILNTKFTYNTIELLSHSNFYTLIEFISDNNKRKSYEIISDKVVKYFIEKEFLNKKDFELMLKLESYSLIKDDEVTKIKEHFNFDNEISKYINIAYPFMLKNTNLSKYSFKNFYENGLVRKKTEAEIKNDIDLENSNYDDIYRDIENKKNIPKQNFGYLWELEKNQSEEKTRKVDFLLSKSYREDEFVDGSVIENALLSLKLLDIGEFDKEKINRVDLERKILEDLYYNNILQYAIENKNLFSSKFLPEVYLVEKNGFYKDNLVELKKKIFDISGFNKDVYEKIDALVEYDFGVKVLEKSYSFHKIAYFEEKYPEKFEKSAERYHEGVEYYNYNSGYVKINKIFDEYMIKTRGLDYFLEKHKTTETLCHNIDLLSENISGLLDRSNTTIDQEKIIDFIRSYKYQVGCDYHGGVKLGYDFYRKIIEKFNHSVEILSSNLKYMSNLNAEVAKELFYNGLVSDVISSRKLFDDSAFDWVDNEEFISILKKDSDRRKIINYIDYFRKVGALDLNNELFYAIYDILEKDNDKDSIKVLFQKSSYFDDLKLKNNDFLKILEYEYVANPLKHLFNVDDMSQENFDLFMKKSQKMDDWGEKKLINENLNLFFNKFGSYMNDENMKMSSNSGFANNNVCGILVKEYLNRKKTKN